MGSGVDGLDAHHPGQSAVDAVAAGQDIVGHANEARGRINALELLQTGCSSGISKDAVNRSSKEAGLKTASAENSKKQQSANGPFTIKTHRAALSEAMEGKIGRHLLSRSSA